MEIKAGSCESRTKRVNSWWTKCTAFNFTAGVCAQYTPCFKWYP